MGNPRTRQGERVDRQRNREVVDALARRRWNSLRAVARRHGIPTDHIDDVVQAALLATLRSFPGPDDSESAYRYAAACVQSEAWKARRRFARKESHQRPLPEGDSGDRAGTRSEIPLLDVDASDPADIAIAHEGARQAHDLLLELPPDQRAVLLLGAAGFGTREIAERLGISPRAVRKRVERGNRRLRERFRDR